MEDACLCVLLRAWVCACREEEASFSRTLQKGIERFKKAAANSGSGSFSGKDAFELYDTYGFPMDLTEVLPPQTVYAHSLQCMSTFVCISALRLVQAPGIFSTFDLFTLTTCGHVACWGDSGPPGFPAFLTDTHKMHHSLLVELYTCLSAMLP